MEHRNWLKVFAVTLLFAVFSAFTAFAGTYTVSVSPDSTGNYVCDGSADDVEINQALVAAAADSSAGGGIVYLKGGTYTVTATLFIGENTELTQFNDSTAVLTVPNASTPWAAGTAIIKTMSVGTYGVKIHGFEINGNRAGITGAVGTAYTACMFSANARYAQVYDMYIHDSWGAGVVFSTGSSTAYNDSLFVHDNQIIGVGGNGVQIPRYTTNSFIYNNTINLVSGTYCPVRVDDAGSMKIYNNIIYGNGTNTGMPQGIHIKHAASSVMTNIEVYGNTISYAYGAGIWIYSTLTSAYSAATNASASIHHNKLINCGTGAGAPAIRTNGFSLLIQNNVMDSCAYGGYETLYYSSTKEFVDSAFVYLQNNIFANCTADSAIGARKLAFGTEVPKERVIVQNNCFYNCMGGFNPDSVATAAANLDNTDPLFADAANYDYHLKSVQGRWDGSGWVTDDVTSPCIDAGVDTCAYSNEPAPNGSRINVGLYGNTDEASKTYVDPTLYVTMSPDSTGDFVCDGTDDDVEIRAALALVNSSELYNCVFLTGPATYNVDTTLSVGSNVELTGDSTAVLNLVGSTTVNMIKTTTAAAGIKIHGFEIDGNDVGSTASAYVIVLNGATSNVEIYDMYIHDSMSGAIQGAGSPVNTSIHDCRLINTNAAPIVIGTNAAGNNPLNLSVYDNTIYTRKGNGISVLNANPLNISNNTLSASSVTWTSVGRGIDIRRFNAVRMDSIEISGNKVSYFYGAGLYIYNSSTTAYASSQASGYIHHNTIINCGSDSLAVKASAMRSNGFNLLIQNNVMDSCAYGGYETCYAGSAAKEFVDSAFVRLQNNIITNCTMAAGVVARKVYLGGSVAKENVIIQNNCFYNCVSNWNADSIYSATNNLVNTNPLVADAVNHDYHLKSQEGRWDGSVWVTDDVTSSCIDAGVDTCAYDSEPAPNGNRINIGLYGNTDEASKTYIDPTLYVTMSPDSTGDFVCDGTNDDVEINAALALVRTGGGLYDTVYLKGAVTYMIDSTLYVGSNTTLTGDSSVVVKIVNNALWPANAGVFYGAMISASASADSNITICGFELDGNVANNQETTAGNRYHGLYIRSLVKYLDVHDMYIHDCLGNGIYYRGSYATVYGNTIERISFRPIYFYVVNTADVYENDIKQKYEGGIYLDTVINAKVHGNTVTKVEGGSAGIVLDCQTDAGANSNNEIYENTLYNINTAGIWAYSRTPRVQTGSMLKIHHNKIYGAGAAKTQYSGGVIVCGYNALIENNVVDSSYAAGISTKHVFSTAPTAGSYTVTVRNNIVTNVDSVSTAAGMGYGIWNAYSPVMSIVSQNNCVYGAVTSIVADSLTADSGSIFVDPLFADAANHDYHLKSQEGRWDGTAWVKDDVTSSCIDAGYDSSAYANEPEPNGGRINVGLYGNTEEASKTYVKPLGPILYVAADGSGDFTTDGVNDEIEINAALSMADTSDVCDTVYLKGPATYVIDSMIVVGSKIELTGDSTVVIALRDSAGWYSKVPMLKVLSGGRDISIHGFEIFGNEALNRDVDPANPAKLHRLGAFFYNAIQVDSLCANVNIYDMYIHENLNDGINVTRCDSVFIHDNTLFRTGYDGIALVQTTNAQVYNNDIRVRYCVGIRERSSNKLKIYDNTIYGGNEFGREGQYGIMLSRLAGTWPSNEIEVYGNTVHNTLFGGIQAYAEAAGASGVANGYAHIHHNKISAVGDSSSTSAFGAFGCTSFNLLIENNVVDSSRTGGIYVPSLGAADTDAGYVIIARNNIFNNAVYGSANKAVTNQRQTKEKIILQNNCFYGNALDYDAATDSITATGNVFADPLFADAANRDYHLKSTTGRWDGSAWVKDSVISPCIDAGFDSSAYDNEPEPNGGRINIGLYGNTAEASKSLLPSILYVTMSPDSTGYFVCDGTKDQIEINQALTIADTSSQYHTVYLVAGSTPFVIDSTLFIGNATTLTGDSTAVVKVADGAAWPNNVFAIYPIRMHIRDVKIHGFEIDGNRAAAAYVGTNNTICVLDSTVNVEIYDMKIHSAGADLMDIRYGDSTFVHDNILYDANNDGMLLYRAQNVSVYNNDLAVRVRDGIRVASTNHAKVYGNTIYGTAETEVHGIAVRNASAVTGAVSWPMTDVQVFDNTIHNIDQSAIYVYCTSASYIDTTNAVKVNHNTIYSCGTGSTAGYSAVTTYGFNMQFENNVVDSCMSGGFAVYPYNGGTAKGFNLYLRNNIFSNSVADTAVVVRRTGSETVYLENNCLFNNLVSYNDSLTNVANNITSDPLFADAGAHDYHLKSQEGRWDGAAWVNDSVTSPCIDAGYAGSDFSLEPAPNGGVINIGRYGNTAEASRHYTKVVIATPAVFSLSQNVPNPFNPSTTISYSIGSECMVKLTIYNVAGQKVATLVNTKQAPGVHSLRWKPEHLASGIYFCRIEAGNFSKTTKLVFMK